MVIVAKEIRKRVVDLLSDNIDALVAVNNDDELLVIADKLNLIYIKEDVIDKYCKENHMRCDVLEFSDTKLRCDIYRELANKLLVK